MKTTMMSIVRRNATERVKRKKRMNISERCQAMYESRAKRDHKEQWRKVEDAGWSEWLNDVGEKANGSNPATQKTNVMIHFMPPQGA